MSRKCLAIGVSTVEPVDGAAFPPLDGAVIAADIIAQWALHSGFAESDVMVLTDKGANRVTDTALQDAFDQLIPVGTTVDHFVLAFTGHGLTGSNDDKTYWLLSDSLDQGYKIFVEGLRRELFAYGIKHLTIFSDACRAIANSRDLRGLLTRPGVRKRHQPPLEPEVARFNACQDATSTFMVKGAAAPGKCIFSGVLAEALWGRVPAAFNGTIIDAPSLGLGLRIAAKERATQYNLTLVPGGSCPFDKIIYFDQARPPLPPDPELQPWPPPPAHHQPNTHTLVLDATVKLGPMENPHPNIDPTRFHANIIEVPGQRPNLTVFGRATGDYRVERVFDGAVQDRPGTDPTRFHAKIIEVPGQPPNLTVTGEATGDYRVESVSLVRAHHQPNTHTLVLDVIAKLGPVENPHHDIERVFELEYKEDPARHRYNKVEIVNGDRSFGLTYPDTLDPDKERVDLEYKEDPPTHRYNKVEIMNGDSFGLTHPGIDTGVAFHGLPDIAKSLVESVSATRRLLASAILPKPRRQELSARLVDDLQALQVLAAGEARRKKAEGLRRSLKKRAARPTGGNKHGERGRSDFEEAHVLVNDLVRQIWSEKPIRLIRDRKQAAFAPVDPAYEGVLMLEFADGLFAPVWFYRDLVCTMLRDDEGVAAISYRHIYDGAKGTGVAATVISRLLTRDLSVDEVDKLATQLRYEKHVNPVFGAIAAYCYDVAGDLNSIRRMATYYGQRGQAAPYDIVFMGMIGNDGTMAHVPEVPRDIRQREGKQPHWLTAPTDAQDVRIAGRCPWLREGWDFVSTPEDAELPLVDGLDRFRATLTASVFTTLNRDGGEALTEKWQLQPNL